MNKLLKPAILSISLLIIMTNSTISPALGEISESFSNVNPNWVKMILTLPSIIIIPFSLLSSKMSVTISQRKIIIIGLIFYIFGGIGGSFTANIYELLFFRGILGAGMGFLMPFTRSLIADFFLGNERTKMMGYSNAAANLGSIIATLTAGWIAVYNWKYVFFIYFIAVISLLLIIIGLPEPKARNKIESKHYCINSKVIILATLAFFINVAFYAVVINIALFIKSKGLGNSQEAGIAMSILTLAGFLSSVFLQNLSKTFKRFNTPSSIALMGIGFFILSTGYNLFIIFLASFMIGFSLGILKPTIFLKVVDITPQYSNAFALSIVSGAIFLGKFLSPFILNFISFLLNDTSINLVFAFVGVTLSIASLISLIYSFHSSQIKIYK
ncbi:MFS transporter [Caldisalinibacter kiritimatiensis]|uniref:Major facilitator superfamily (MFS) profile domain-containing protein n=1 Tax=Caldisalinibacter kiritimatiensis TaxID=1304284 RepID=R1CSF0_9FIRM|nr:MFS transporter [Caldisalinibacter kiritimatiensis]EOD01581.1 hypothetical protein L21TH_0320 [Caldisalinibacter kiritimatiensis]